MPDDFEIYYVTASTSVDVRDRAMNYGDGCFTSILFNGDNFCLLKEHIDRLFDDATCLSFNLDKNELQKGLLSPLKNIKSQYNGQHKAIKVLVSRGVGGRGYQTPDQVTVNIYITVHDCLPPQYPKEMSLDYEYHLGVCDFSLASQSLFAGVKHLNRLEQVLAKHRLKRYSYLDDFIMLDSNNRLVEATSANIFVKLAGYWCTPRIESAGVDGVMRRHVMKTMLEQGIEIKTRDIYIDDLQQAQSVFLTNAISLVIPVSHLHLKNKANESITLNDTDQSTVKELMSLFASNTLYSELVLE
ncbi:aminodeoxychorismate lyase [Glaciecola petra]|uniref:Aminodeoxychorismate lyase n=1 Tax=Glaciecola petra TaxID=3075602 RepID=A0ABU2ZNX4_9ALTE|nr:aminodeoxychorismate lyase [Aestuariibacter sp. P117]MDT0594329.1 aminodeoxychorismate lyase [Aestuariibacter sp. P117]